MVTELSSNWKKLQSILKNEAPIIDSKKRTDISTDRLNNSLAKRRRLNTNVQRSTISKKPTSATKMNSKLDEELDETELIKSYPNPPSVASLNSWAKANDISSSDLVEAYGDILEKKNVTYPDVINEGLREKVEIGKYVGVDCEMVGVGKRDMSVLARISIVNFHGIQVYDSYVKPREFVTNWRSDVSGITPKKMMHAREFTEVQANVAAIIKNRIVVGHALWNDFRVLELTHPKKDTRDTSLFAGFRQISHSNSPSLKVLAKKVLGLDIQSGQHSSIEDARATMFIFRRYKAAFDAEHIQRYPNKSLASSSSRTKKKKRK
ncbi:RNA exonuclease 4 [Golovinomyces cichoracearum]|uniref:RNA exonuclease 4 n=1 Tax=Golovinomyces cichoracearum TaxID=62708 RepID=A0A420IA71_9PEZI|nr:RNA exonuclease 4 [Golovinomyces cichoracearum]